MIHLTARLSCPTDGSILDPAATASAIANLGGNAFGGVNTHLHMTVSAAKAAKKAGVDFIPGYLDPRSGLAFLAGSPDAWSWIVGTASGVFQPFMPDGLHAIIPTDHPIVSGIDHRPQEAYAKLCELRDEWGPKLSGELSPGQGRWGDALKAADVSLMAGNSPRHMRPEDAFALEVYRCIGTGQTLSEFKRPRVSTSDRWLCDVDWWRQGVPDAYAAAALRRTREIADACTFRIEPPKRPYMPKAHGIDDADAALRERAWAGLAARGLSARQEHRDRLTYELNMIAQLGWSDYFLVVDEFIGFAHSAGIPVGPGRGSGAGSLVAYALRITGVDPLAYGLFFERFLNPERVSIPDFDIDFCMNRRGEVIRHVEEVHGRDRVSQICTIGRLQLRAVIKDVGRVLGYSFNQTNEATQRLPQPTDEEIKDITSGIAGEMTIEEALAEFPEMIELPDLNPLGQYLFPIAKTLFKLPKSIGVHAAGVVIADRSITDVAPIVEVEGKRAIQFDMDAADHMGLVKFDFLGLTTLTAIQRAAEISGITVDPDTLDLDDPDILALFEVGDTEHVFQFAGRSFRRVLKKMQPNRFGDLVAAAALYRPGPKDAGMLDDFIARKRGEQDLEALDPRLDAVLEETLGVVVYQEQVMQLAQLLAGYSLGAADLLRRAMGKKKVEAMAAERVKFVSGAVERGLSAQRAGHIFDLVAKFAGYGFNKSHSVVYALIAYITAYYRVHAPVAYAAAELEVHHAKPEKVGPILRWIRSCGIELRQPDINGPIDHCAAEGGAVRIGLHVVKGIGNKLVEEIVRARAAGPFGSMDDFFLRVSHRVLGKDSLLRIAQCGAFDDLEGDRASAIQRAVELGAYKPQQPDARMVAFDIPPPIPKRGPMVDPMLLEDVLDLELDIFGAYISGHPADVFLDHHHGLTSIESIAHKQHGDRVLVGGLVSGVEVYIPSDGRKTTGSFTLEGPRGLSIDVKTSGQTWGEIRGWITEGALIVLSARVNRASDVAVPDLRVLGHEDGERTPVRMMESTDPILVSLPGEPDESIRNALRELLRDFPGKAPLLVEMDDTEGQRVTHTVKGGVQPWAKLDIQRAIPDATVDHIDRETP